MSKDKSTVNLHAGHRQRLREKYDADRELTAFQDHEILEYILSLVIPRKDTNELAHEMINKFGSLHNIFMSTPTELLEFKNMTTSAAYLLAAIYPAVRRSLRTPLTFTDTVDVRNYALMAEYMQPKFIGRTTECISVLYLNVRYKVLFIEWIDGAYPEKISINGEAIAKRAVKEGAKYVVFAHNHPTQNITPSNEDIVETCKIYALLAAVGVDLLDSLIFSDTGYISFRRNGIIDHCDREYYNKVLNSEDSLRSPRYYSPVLFGPRLRENLLNFDKLRKEGILQAYPSDEPLSEEADKDPRNK